jgi:hypothetical protein
MLDQEGGHRRFVEAHEHRANIICQQIEASGGERVDRAWNQDRVRAKGERLSARGRHQARANEHATALRDEANFGVELGVGAHHEGDREPQQVRWLRVRSRLYGLNHTISLLALDMPPGEHAEPSLIRRHVRPSAPVSDHRLVDSGQPNRRGAARDLPFRKAGA